VAVTVEPVHQTVALFGVIIGGIQASAATPRAKRRAARSLNEDTITVVFPSLNVKHVWRRV